MAPDAEDLELFINNTANLSPQGSHGQGRSIAINLLKKMRKGVYSKEQAPKLWEYLAESGAKQWAKDERRGAEWSRMFPPAVRREAAKLMARAFEQEVKTGAYDHLEGELPKNLQKGAKPRTAGARRSDRKRAVRWDPASGVRERLALLTHDAIPLRDSNGRVAPAVSGWKYDPSRDHWKKGKLVVPVRTEASQSLERIARRGVDRREAMQAIGYPDPR